MAMLNIADSWSEVESSVEPSMRHEARGMYYYGALTMLGLVVSALIDSWDVPACAGAAMENLRDELVDFHERATKVNN